MSRLACTDADELIESAWKARMSHIHDIAHAQSAHMRECGKEVCKADILFLMAVLVLTSHDHEEQKKITFDMERIGGPQALRLLKGA